MYDRTMRIARLLSALVPGLLLAVAVACDSGGGGLEPPTDSIGGTTDREAVRVDGELRGYVIFVPDNLPAQNRRVLVGLHGQGSFGREFLSVTGLDFLADSLGMIAVFPDGVQSNWMVEDTAFFNAIVDSLTVRYGADPAGVHVVGFSQGGGLGHVLVCTMADRVRSLSVVGTSLLRETAEGCAPSRPTPVFYLLGTQDVVAPWAETAQSLGGEESARWWAEANGCEAEPAREEDSRLIRLNWDDCQGGARVRMIGVFGGGHSFFPLQNFNTLGELVDWLTPIL